MGLPSVAEVEAEVNAFIDQHWDLEMTVGEWWQALTDARLMAPSLPEAAYGRGWNRELANAVLRTLASRDCIGPPTGLGMMLAAPTIAAHGSPEQIDRYIPRILNGQDAWCQLFSEPGAGSDLAGLQTRAERDGDEWIVNGQKVWTSGGQAANMGMLVARTDSTAPKHQGMTYFAMPMQQPGVDVRPLREMTGRALFNEVFLDNARVADDAMIGGLGDGWRVANTTLAVERSHLGASAVPIASTFPGPIVGNIAKPVSQYNKRKGGEAGVPPVGPALWRRYVDLARSLGRLDDPVVRDELAQLWTLCEVSRMNGVRAKGGSGRTGGEGNIAKLFMSEMYRRFSAVGARLLGPGATLLGEDAPSMGMVQEVVMFAPGPAIYGGTDQVQRNILGERVLGLPKEPGPAKETPFKDLLNN